MRRQSVVGMEREDGGDIGEGSEQQSVGGSSEMLSNICTGNS